MIDDRDFGVRDLQNPWPSAGPSPTGIGGTCEQLTSGVLELTLWNGEVWHSPDSGDTWTKQP